MGIKTGNCSDAQLLDRYINSSYDKVANVSDNMPSVVTVSNNIDDVNTTADAANSGLLDNLQEFNNIYYGGFVSEAALELLYSGNRPDGNPRQNGDLYYNTTADAMFVWSVSAWTTLTSYSTIREIQTVASPTDTIYFSDIAYTVGAENLTVYLNGVLQVHSPADAPNTKDYEEINGSTIQFNELLEVGDELTAFSGNILGNVEINVNTIIDSYTGADVVANVLTLDTSYATGQNNIYVYVNGIFQASGINYTESSTTTITFDTALDASDTITVITGIIANNNTTSISSRTQIFNIVNDTTNSVTVDAGNEYIPGSNHIQMFINGVKQIYGEAYIENADRRTLTLTDGVYFESGDIVEVVVGVVITNYPQPITFTKQEVQTATAGQTTFTLTNSFSSGANNLSVYINGVKMLPTDYTEDSNSQITFSSGLNLGDKVQFIVGEVFDGTQSAAATSYTPAGTGAVTTTVEAKLRESVSVKDFGAVGDGVTDDTAAIQAALDVGTSSGKLVTATGTFLCSELTFTTDSSLVGLGNCTLLLKDDTHIANITGNNVLIDNVIFDGNSISKATDRYLVNVESGATNLTFKNSTIQNLTGNRDNQYGLYIDLNNVQNFIVDSCKFYNITNNGDSIATYLGFTGGIFLINQKGAAITDGEQSSGTISNCDFDTIFTTYKAGATVAEKQEDNDADAIRFYSGEFPVSNVAISLINNRFKRVGKRAVKLSSTGGVIIDGLYCDGSDPVDTDVPMPSIIKVSTVGDAIISNVNGYFGSYRCSSAIQIAQNVSDVVIDNMLVDNCLYLVENAGDIAGNIVISNISCSVNGGINLSNTSSQSRIIISNASLKFDRVNDFDTSDIFYRGFVVDNYADCSINNVYIHNGQAFLSLSDSTVNNVFVDWTDTTDLSTYGLGTSSRPLFILSSCTNSSMSNLRCVTADALPSYFSTPLGNGVFKIYGSDNLNVSNIYCKSALNNPFNVSRSGKINIDTVVVESEGEVSFGDFYGLTDSYVGTLKLEGTGRIYFIQLINGLVIDKIIKRAADSTALFLQNNANFSNSFINAVYWYPDSGNSLLTLTGITRNNEYKFTTA